MIIFGQSFQSAILQKMLNATAQDAKSIQSLKITPRGEELWQKTVGEVFGKWHDQDEKSRALPNPKHRVSPWPAPHLRSRQDSEGEKANFRSWGASAVRGWKDHSQDLGTNCIWGLEQASWPLGASVSSFIHLFIHSTTIYQRLYQEALFWVLQERNDQNRA